MKVHIDEMKLKRSCFKFEDGSGWSAKRLIKKSKGLKVFKLQLAALDLDGLPFNIDSTHSLIFQIKRVKDTKLKYPIILNKEGMILDGWHRVIKAIIKGNKTIKAVRFKENPSKNIKQKEEEIL